MEHPNDNMEEFFKKSLDKFNDDPSAAVWDNLDAKLDQDTPKAVFMQWMRYLLPAAVLLLSLTGMYVYQLKVLSEYKTELSAVVQENKDLKQEVSLLNNSNPKVATSNEIESQALTLNDMTQAVATVERDTIYITKFRTKNLWTPALANSSFSFAPTYRQANSSVRFNAINGISPYNSYAVAGGNQGSGVSAYSAENNGGIGFDSAQGQKENQQQLSILSSPLIGLRLDGLQSINHDDPFVDKMKYAYHKSKRKRKKFKLGLFENKGPVIVAKGDVWGQPEFYYRAGVSLNVLSSLKGEVFSNSSIGVGYGFMQEIGLTSRFAVTSGIMRNHQEYALSNNGLPLDASEISNFPFQEDLNSAVDRVEVENKFLEIPLGVKYDFYQDNQKSFFINPAVKWSIHEPQNFSYFLTEDRFRTFTTNQRFGYLNAIHLAVGLEKIINPSITYQVSIGYDYNLEPIGVERQRLNSLYLKANLLFGRK